MIYRVISDRYGLMWTGCDREEAHEVALIVAVNTARTTYLQEGVTR